MASTSAMVAWNVAASGPQAVGQYGSIDAPNPVRNPVFVPKPQSLAVDVVAHDNKGIYTAVEPGQQKRSETACYSSTSATSASTPGLTKRRAGSSAPPRKTPEARRKAETGSCTSLACCTARVVKPTFQPATRSPRATSAARRRS